MFNFDTGTDGLVEIEQDLIATAGVGYADRPGGAADRRRRRALRQHRGQQGLGQIDGPFKRAVYTSSSGETENRGGESTLGNQVAEVQRWATQLPDQGVAADIAFMNPGGLRADMVGTANGGGAVTSPTARPPTCSRSPTRWSTWTLTGAQIETVLEQQWQRTPTGNVPSRPFLRLGVSKGFTYTYVETPGDRVERRRQHRPGDAPARVRLPGCGSTVSRSTRRRRTPSR